MRLSLADYENRTREAVAEFWSSREASRAAQQARGTQDAGARGAVTGGKNMDGFLPLIEAILRENGLPDAVVEQKKVVRTIPGFYRPTKSWDYVVTRGSRLIALMEMKSQVGSFGNNFNNRCEEAVGSAADFRRAFEEGAFGKGAPLPFVGYLMLVEDCQASRSVVGVEPTLFRVFPEFDGTSYIDRYKILCQKLVSERLYTVATVLASPTGSVNGAYSEVSSDTGMRRFVSILAGAVAAAAADSEDLTGGLFQEQ